MNQKQVWFRSHIFVKTYVLYINCICHVRLGPQQAINQSTFVLHTYKHSKRECHAKYCHHDTDTMYRIGKLYFRACVYFYQRWKRGQSSKVKAPALCVCCTWQTRQLSPGITAVGLCSFLTVLHYWWSICHSSDLGSRWWR